MVVNGYQNWNYMLMTIIMKIKKRIKNEMLVVFKLNDKVKIKNNLRKDLLENIEYIKSFFIKYQNVWFNSTQLIEFMAVGNIKPIKNSSQIRTIINYLRVEMNLPIISSHKGYKYSTSKIELQEYYEQLRYRALCILSASKSIKNNI